MCKAQLAKIPEWLISRYGWSVRCKMQKEENLEKIVLNLFRLYDLA